MRSILNTIRCLFVKHRFQRLHSEDGVRVEPAPMVVARFHASLRALLTAERTALNLLQRMSGIATTTHRHVVAVKGTGVEVLDTRKTAPGMRALDKAAVACGGGSYRRRMPPPPCPARAYRARSCGCRAPPRRFP